MRKESIKEHIDRKILKNLSEMGYDGMRSELLDVISRFNTNIIEPPVEETEQSIEKIVDTRSRYMSFYIFFARKRIIDLYKIEARDWYGWDGLKKFKALILKDKLSR